MEVLFVCKGNVGRSQMAEAIFNSLADGKATASSAGVKVGDYEGKTIADIGPVVVECMRDINIDISRNTPKALTKEMFDHADIVVSMVENRDLLPEYVRSSGKVLFWDIENPKLMGHESTAKVRDAIYRYVSALVEQIRSRSIKKARHSYK